MTFVKNGKQNMRGKSHDFCIEKQSINKREEHDGTGEQLLRIK